MSDKAITSTGQAWEEQARNWITWVRTPELDSYWRYRSAFFELVPDSGRSTLDLGCGEGRVARDLAARGHRVTGVDASPTLIGAASAAHPEGEYTVADAADLPFPDDSFDLAIAYNSLIDVDDLPGAVREAGRVLRPGGRLVLSILHPANTGIRTGEGDDLAFVVDGSYFTSRRTEDLVERQGISMKFTGYQRPLSAYTRALEETGFLIEAVREPIATRADGSPHRLPWHLWIKAIRHPGSVL
ncbi:class I SAM-dependent methyltransferase [Amycolatopsis taiwanensis]|uniref:class I SAM-dependent methyltransferase n=1 Tax=Amycolatopsis taiwanensis TaxID=342230 RepID=UPI000488C8E6|nr:class I SAM-dependent methyltransferase [Amycolatopsis taiwanensis]